MDFDNPHNRDDQERYEAIRQRIGNIPAGFKKADFNPLIRASRILHAEKDVSSVSKSRDELEKLSKSLSDDLDFLVEHSFDGCYVCLESFEKIAQLMNVVGVSVRSLEDIVGNSKDSLMISGKELKTLYESNVMYKMMVKILGCMEKVIDVPNRIETLVGNKQYTQAIKIINDAVSVIEKHKLLEINASRDLVATVFDLRSKFPHILVDELEAHLYVKVTSTIHAFESQNEEQAADSSGRGKRERPDRFGEKRFDMNDVVDVEGREDEEESVSRDPQSDTFYYMKFLVGTLFYLDRPEETMKTITKNSSKEIAKLVLGHIKSEADRLGLSAAVGSYKRVKARDRNGDITISPTLSSKEISTFRNSVLGKLAFIFENHVFINDFFEKKCKEKSLSEIMGRNETRLRSVWAFIQEEIKGFVQVLLAYREAEDDEDDLNDVLAPAQPLFSLDQAEAVRSVTNTSSIPSSPQGAESGGAGGASASMGMVAGFGAVFAKSLVMGVQKASQDVEKIEEKVRGIAGGGGGGGGGGDEKSSNPSARSTSKGGASSSSSDLTGDSQGKSISNEAISIQDRLSVFNPTPYNIDILYTPITQFEERMVEHLGSKRELFELRRFLDEYVNNDFIPRLTRDSEMLATSAMEGYAAFKTGDFVSSSKDSASITSSGRPHSISASTSPSGSLRQSTSLNTNMSLFLSGRSGSPSVVCSAQTVAQLMSGLLQHARALPRFCEDIVGIVESVLGSYFKVCVSRIGKVTEGKFVNRYSEVRVLYEKDPEWSDVMTSVFASLISSGTSAGSGGGGEDNSPMILNMISKRGMELNSSQFFTKLEEDETSMIDNPSVLHESALNQTSQLGFFGSMQFSLQWLVKEISSVRDSLLASKGKSKSTMDGFEGLKSLYESFQSLSVDCLLMLKMELRYHVHFYLGQLTKSNLSLDEEAMEPEHYIIDLNKDLAAIELSLNSVLKATTLKYLFSGIAPLMCTLILNHITKVKKITKNGVKRMIRNVNALQQNLTSISVLPEEQKISFDKLRRFFDLCSCLKHQDALKKVAELHHSDSLDFTKDEIITCLRLVNSHVPEVVMNRVHDIYRR